MPAALTVLKNHGFDYRGKFSYTMRHLRTVLNASARKHILSRASPISPVQNFALRCFEVSDDPPHENSRKGLTRARDYVGLRLPFFGPVIRVQPPPGNPNVFGTIGVTTVTLCDHVSPLLVQLKRTSEKFVKERLQSCPDVLLSGPFRKVSSVPRNGLFICPKVGMLSGATKAAKGE